MKREEIERLSGIDLAYAVARAKGLFEYELSGYPYWATVTDTSNHMFVADMDNYRPDLHLLEAWELVQDLWDGRHPRQANGKDPVVSCVDIQLSDCIPQEMSIKVFSPTLADVVVFGFDSVPTMICRAYLMVVVGEDDDEQDGIVV